MISDYFFAFMAIKNQIFLFHSVGRRKEWTKNKKKIDFTFLVLQSPTHTHTQAFPTLLQWKKEFTLIEWKGFSIAMKK